jgi:hypothetical protein
MAAWFFASNHCALATPTAPAKASAGSQCPMHAQKEHAPQPQKENGCGDLPCCKNLQATMLSAAKTIAKPVWFGRFQPFFALIVDAARIEAQQVSVIFDTGPPGENSFVRSVLQRSILTHAPPVSLS